jgi:adenylate kinase family enzyme
VPQVLQRVVVVGTSGCGKTTFAKQLAETLQSTHIELDRLFWLPNWNPRNPDDFRRQVEQHVRENQWVVDGNYGALRDMIWSRATHLIWLNYSYPLVIWQVTKRTIVNLVSNREVFPGCRETLSKAFLSKESVIWWAMTTYHRRQQKYLSFRQEQIFPHLTWVEIHNPREGKQFLESLKTVKSAA